MRSKSLKETGEIARGFLGDLKPKNSAVVVGLMGDLGSGKTTFVQAMARHLGLTDLVTSPTFVIEKVYRVADQPFENLIHVDAHRLKNGGDLRVLGWDEALEGDKNLIVVEWPEKVHEVLPDDTHMVKFFYVDENTREIIFNNA